MHACAGGPWHYRKYSPILPRPRDIGDVQARRLARGAGAAEPEGDGVKGIVDDTITFSPDLGVRLGEGGQVGAGAGVGREMESYGIVADTITLSGRERGRWGGLKQQVLQTNFEGDA